MVHFEIKNLTFSYPDSKGKKVLDDVSFTIEKGDFVTVCGKSGSGKTTLLKHLKSVLAPHGKQSGEIFFRNVPMETLSLREQAEKIGFVMQNPDNQIVTDKVWHELAFGLESLGTDQRSMRLRVAEMAQFFGISDWFHKDVSELSGGQKQLLNLASVMAMQPEVLVLDEPTSQLDPIAAADLLNTIKKINRELRTTIIMTEHRLEDIFYVSDQVIVMEAGRLVAKDTPQNIGALLREKKDDLFLAMPAPVKIYYGVDNTLPCPLTVREGAAWLDRLLEEKANPVTGVSEESKKETQPYSEENREQKPILTLKEVWYRYEKNLPDVLRGVDLEVPKCSIYAVMGGNGTGKSTMLRAICNICRPYRGRATLDGKAVEKYKTDELFRHNLALLPQDPQSLFVRKTVLEELEEMLETKDVSGCEGRREKISELCHIEHLAGQHPFDLSGGEQQRVALAKVLLTEPKVLMLDEPTKGLDNFFKAEFAGILSDLKKQGTTVLMVSHDVEFCAKYADYVSLFFDGAIITTNTPRKFFSQNSFYTTAANRMSRHWFPEAITDEDVIELCRKNL